MLFRYGIFVGCVVGSQDTPRGRWFLTVEEDGAILAWENGEWRNGSGALYQVVCPD